MDTHERTKTISYIVIFSVLVTVVAWIAPLFGGSPSSPGLGFIIWGTAPLVVSVLIRLISRDWSNFGIKPAIKENALWYLVSIMAFPALMLLTLLTGSFLSISSITNFSLGAYLQTALTAFPIFFIFAIFEEVGWRAYLAPKLAALEINRYGGAALLAVVWTLWHVPYLQDLTWVYSPESMLSFIPRYYLVLFAFALIYGELRGRSGTFWTAVLLHTMSNAFGHPFAVDYVSIAEGYDYLASVSTGFIMIAFALILGIIMIQRCKRSNPVVEMAS